MTYLVERLAQLRRHLKHLKDLRGRAISAHKLERDLTLHNDVLFSLLTVCQLVIDVSGELSSQHGLTFADYTESVRNLGRLDLLDDETLARLERLPGFRNVIVHEYVALDLERVLEALDELAPIERFLEAVGRWLSGQEEP